MSETFGHRLRLLRVKKNLSQRQLAERVGINHTYLSKMEKGRLDPPSTSTLHKLAEVLEDTYGELVFHAYRIPSGLKRTMSESSLLTELVHVLGEQLLPDEVYIRILHIVYEAQTVEKNP